MLCPKHAKKGDAISVGLLPGLPGHSRDPDKPSEAPQVVVMHYELHGLLEDEDGEGVTIRLNGGVRKLTRGIIAYVDVHSALTLAPGAMLAPNGILAAGTRP